MSDLDPAVAPGETEVEMTLSVSSDAYTSPQVLCSDTNTGKFSFTPGSESSYAVSLCRTPPQNLHVFIFLWILEHLSVF